MEEIQRQREHGSWQVLKATRMSLQLLSSRNQSVIQSVILIVG